MANNLAKRSWTNLWVLCSLQSRPKNDSSFIIPMSILIASLELVKRFFTRIRQCQILTVSHCWWRWWHNNSHLATQELCKDRNALLIPAQVREYGPNVHSLRWCCNAPTHSLCTFPAGFGKVYLPSTGFQYVFLYSFLSRFLTVFLFHFHIIFFLFFVLVFLCAWYFLNSWIFFRFMKFF